MYGSSRVFVEARTFYGSTCSVGPDGVVGFVVGDDQCVAGVQQSHVLDGTSLSFANNTHYVQQTEYANPGCTGAVVQTAYALQVGRE
jgi:hypothetical protein